MQGEGKGLFASGLERKALLAIDEQAAGGGIEDLIGQGAALGGVGEVADGGGKRGAVALAHEARQVALDHEVLAGNDDGVEHAVAHGAVMGQSSELPRGETLGEGEDKAHLATVVGAQCGLEVGRLGKVGAHLYTRLGHGVVGLGGCVVLESRILGIADYYFL